MVKRVIKISTCIFIICLVYLLLDRIFRVKLSSQSMVEYYAQDTNTVDVVIVGSSHAGYNIDVRSFYSNHGISAYVLWSGNQHFNQSYWYIKEALASQSPKLIILETYGAVFFDDVPRARMIQTVSQLKRNLNRISMIIDIDTETNHKINDFFGLPNYHQRYNQLTKTDFSYILPNSGMQNLKGPKYVYTSKDGFVWEDASKISEVKQLDPTEESYLRKIIELCQARNIPLLLIKTPTEKRLERQPIYNRVAEIAQEYDLPFINYNLLDNETGIEDSDNADGTHLNASGARKVGRHLADYVATHYDLPDHRGDPKYASWDIFAQETKKDYLTHQTKPETWLSSISTENIALFIAKNGHSEKPENDNNALYNSLSSLGLNTAEVRNADYAVWVSEDTSKQTPVNRYKGGLSLEMKFDEKKFFFDFVEGFSFAYKGHNQLREREDLDYFFIAYDKNSHQIMDMVSYSAKNGGELIRYPVIDENQ